MPVPVLSACPSASQLLTFANGALPSGEERERLLRHLMECRDCAATLQHFPLSDSFLNDLEKRAAADEHTLTPDLMDLLRLHRQNPTPMVGDAQHATLNEGHDDKHWLRLLEPPLDGSEIGRLGQYRILRVLGAGGMGRVFLVEDTHLKRAVALKVMSPHLIDKPAARERFLREARAAASIQDEHIVTIYQVGQINNVPFLAMELLQGESLADRLGRERTLPVPTVLRIGREIAEGLAVAHGRGLVHRDIKPANLWLEQGGALPGGFKRVKILDFGLARAQEGPTSLTASGQVLGTPHYMSPEQARGETIDARSDLFSLGCVLYRLTAGREAFSGATVMAVLTALAVEEPKPLSEFQGGLPEGLIALVRRLLSKDPASRPASAREVAAAIRGLETPSADVTIEKTLPSMQAPARPGRKVQPRYALAALAGVALIALLWYFLGGNRHEAGGDEGNPPGGAGHRSGEPILVGILQSTSGTLSDSATPVVDATVLAIEEINRKGGIRGRKIEYVLRDAQSEPEVCAREAERLLTEDGVQAIFGCWSSAERKRIKPIVEKHDNLLLYPVQFEGMEASPNIVYFGMTPNQQILPAVQYTFTALNRRRYFLVGSDYIFPRAANEIIKDELKALGASVVGESYFTIGETDVLDVVAEIVAAKPDVILNTINGDTNRVFFRALRRAGITSDKTPTVSFSLSEPELKLLGGRDTVGDYAAWCYFMSLSDAVNEEFIGKFQEKFGPDRVTSDPMLSAYVSVHLWAKAVEQAGEATPAKVREKMRGMTFRGAGGELRVDAETLYTWQPFRLGKIVEGPTFEVVWSSEILIRPQPFLGTRSKEAWEQFLAGWYEKWGGRWDNPER